MPAPDYFEFFGLERRLNLDAADLQRRFYRLSRELHPDRFTRSSPAERERALGQSAVLNDAYRVLRDPILRAEYLLSSAGVTPGDEKKVPPELLEVVFELNEAIESADRNDVVAAGSHVTAMLDTVQAELSELFDRHDAGEDVAPPLRAALNRRRYIDKLLRQVEGALTNV